MEKPFLIAAIGEVLWDVFPDARHPGGAPANVAFHASQLGAKSLLVSAVGDDEPGREMLEFLARQGLDCSGVQTRGHQPTGEVTVSFFRGNPSYHVREPAAWDFIEWTDELAELAETCDAVCFGTLAQRHAVSRETIRRFVSETHGWRLFDVNLRKPFVDRDVIAAGMAECDAVKMSETEVRLVARLFNWRQPIAGRLMREFDIELLAITRGSRGCVLQNKTSRVEAAAPIVVEADPVGAGDAFNAALILGHLHGMPLLKMAEFANEVGAFVAGKHGAMPVPPSELCDHLNNRKTNDK